MLRALDQGIWVAEQPLRFLGVEVGARMTVIRLADGRLLVHSPIRRVPERLAAVQALGEVAALIAPNRFHHLFAADWLAACPGARLYLAPGLAAKRPDLAGASLLSDEPEALWQGALEQVVVRGVPMMNEVVFFHPASQTLIATDLAFHIGPEAPAPTRLFIRLTGRYGELAPTVVERLLTRDRSAFRASLERILAWPFERVIVAHGTILERDGRGALARGYDWLLGESYAGVDARPGA